MLSCSLVLLALSSTRATACPVCAGETGDQVRAGVADSATPTAVAAIIAPFAIVAGITLFVHRGVPSSRRRRR
jgi:hypothetical protein